MKVTLTVDWYWFVILPLLYGLGFGLNGAIGCFIVLVAAFWLLPPFISYVLKRLD